MRIFIRQRGFRARPIIASCGPGVTAAVVVLALTTSAGVNRRLSPATARG